jgi:acyl-CoA synthetase (AMP-forming)/AMP-acid ligase II
MPGKADNLDNLLSERARAAESRHHRLEDGRFFCTYGELPAALERIGRFLRQAGIPHREVLALECRNSVPGALVLLYLLSRGYSFLLSPRDAKAPCAVPEFVRCRISVGDPADEVCADGLPDPESYLHILDAGERTRQRNRLPNGERRLYLRTSGSTGTARLAVHKQSKLLRNALNCVDRLGLRSRDRIAIPVPITHMYGLGAAFLPGIAAGAALDLQPGANLIRYLQRERDFDPDIAFLTPPFAATLVAGRRSSRAYRFTVMAGDRVPRDTFSAYDSRFGPVVQLYGSTEMGAIAAAMPEEPLSVRAGSVGRPLPRVRLRLKTGTEGGDPERPFAEILCHHPFGFECYVNTKGKPAGVIPAGAGQWFETRDLGRIGRNGTVEILGRSDHAVNRNGLLVPFAEVENAIESIAGIERSAVVTAGESYRGKGMAAYCVLDPKTRLTGADIRSACFGLLPRHAIPDRVLIVRELPTLPNGKLDRPALQASA